MAAASVAKEALHRMCTLRSVFSLFLEPSTLGRACLATFIYSFIYIYTAIFRKMIALLADSFRREQKIIRRNKTLHQCETQNQLKTGGSQ